MHPQSHTAPALPASGLIVHKTYTIRRSTMLMGLGWLALMTACSGTAGWYILSKDDLAARLISRETTRQYAYEDRIAALRADIDRYASRALLDQDGVESRVDELTTRQAELETRQSLVTALTDVLQSNGILPANKLPLRPRVAKPEEPIRASGVTSFAPIMPGKPTPAPETPALRGAEANASGGWQSGELQPEPPPAKRVEANLERLDKGVGALAARDFENRKAWAKWAEKRAVDFKDDALRKRAREVEAEALRIEAEARRVTVDAPDEWLRLAEEARRTGQDREAAQHLPGKVEVGERGAAHAGAVERERAAEDVGMHPADRGEEP